jgi:hypothetical protein
MGSVVRFRVRFSCLVVVGWSHHVLSFRANFVSGGGLGLDVHVIRL